MVEKKMSKNKAGLKTKIEQTLKKQANAKIDEFLERGDSLKYGDFVRLAKGAVKTEIDKKVPPALKKTKDPTGLDSVLKRSKNIGVKAAVKESFSEKRARSKKKRQAKKQAKRRDKAFGMAAFLLALGVGLVYKLTSKV
ncbi:MAG: hypothetical protein J6P72_02790 [Firmicutes bacterium]|nr:hypothetical protein [Bacillota bacterium]